MILNPWNYWCWKSDIASKNNDQVVQRPKVSLRYLYPFNKKDRYSLKLGSTIIFWYLELISKTQKNCFSWNCFRITSVGWGVVSLSFTNLLSLRKSKHPRIEHEVALFLVILQDKEKFLRDHTGSSVSSNWALKLGIVPTLFWKTDLYFFININ